MSGTPYAINIIRSAQKEIRSLDRVVRERVMSAIRSLVNEPRPPGCRKLVGSQNRWRIRAGDYRVIYVVDDAGPTVQIVAVRHRSKAYEQ